MTSFTRIAIFMLKITKYINSWLEGNDHAYRYIFNFYYPKLLSICLKSMKLKEDSEEMVMNVFINLWRHKAHISKVGDFEKYIYQMLRNQIIDFSRKRILKMEEIENLSPALLGSVNHPELTFKELENCYLQAVDKLPEKRKKIFLMSREEGLSHQEIAERTNTSVHTVNNHIKSATKMLRQTMGEHAEAIPLIIILLAKSIKG